MVAYGEIYALDFLSTLHIVMKKLEPTGMAGSQCLAGLVRPNVLARPVSTCNEVRIYII